MHPIAAFKQTIDRTNECLTFFWMTSNEWITDKTNRATTYRIVIDNLATCILAACASARIDAFLIDAGFIEEALRTDCAFGPAGGRTAHVIFEARANCSFVHIVTLTVWAAWRWHARICWSWRNYSDFKRKQIHENGRRHERQREEERSTYVVESRSKQRTDCLCNRPSRYSTANDWQRSNQHSRRRCQDMDRRISGSRMTSFWGNRYS